MKLHRCSGRLVLLGALLPVLLCGAHSARAQDSAPQSDADLVRFDNALRRMDAYIESLPAYEVQCTQSWTLDGQEKQQGGSEVTLRVTHNGPFRLDIRSRQKPPSSLSCVGKDGRITRLFDVGETHLVSIDSGDRLEALLEDPLAASVTAGSGLDLLCHERTHKFVMANVSDVKHLGEETLDEGKAHHFRCTWEGGETVELWILAQETPLLVRKKRTVTLPDGDRKLVLDSRFTWKHREAWPAKVFELDVPDGATKVNDIYSYLIEGETRQLVGEVLPSVPLKDLSGATRDVRAHKGQSVVCLFFWTTWATASDAQREDVVRLLADFAGSDVAFYAVNVGEPKEEVAEFLRKTGYQGTVLLDMEKKLTEALRITSLPVCVLVGKDGKVASVHVGSTEEDREQVRQDLKSLLESEGDAPRKGQAGGTPEKE